MKKFLSCNAQGHSNNVWDCSSVLCEFLDDDIKLLIEDIDPDQVVFVTDTELSFGIVDGIEETFQYVYVNADNAFNIGSIDVYNSLIILHLHEAILLESIFTNTTLHNLHRNYWIAVSTLPVKEVFDFAYPDAPVRKRLSLWVQLYYLKEDPDDCSKKVTEVFGNANEAPTFHVGINKVVSVVLLTDL